LGLRAPIARARARPAQLIWRFAMPWWFAVAGLAFSSAFCLGTLSLGAYLLLDALRFKWTATRTVGEVVRIHSQWQNVTESTDTGTYTRRMLIHYPVIAFTDEKSTRHEVRANSGSSKQEYQVGDEVPILVDPSDPQKVRINSFASLYFMAACFLFLAGVSGVLFGFWLLYAPW
jgi:hypothetical protein